MARERLPYWQVYPGDIRKDVAFQTLSYHYRGIWWELLMLMHCSEDRGRLVSNGAPIGTAGVSRLLGLSEKEAEQAIQVLTSSGVASRDESGALICRRMVREQETVNRRREAGRLGGYGKALANVKQNNGALRLGELPEDASKPLAKPKAKSKQTSDIDIDSLNCFKKRFGDLFRRRENTNWNDRELAAFARLNGHVAEDDMVAVERYYRENIPKEKDYRRRDLLTLLNNWNGEVDRAKARLPKPRSAPKPLQQTPVADPATEAEFQERLRQWKANGRPLGQFP